MSRAEFDASRLRRLKRVGHRLGLTILSTSKPAPKTGGYMLSVDETRQVVLGDTPVPFSASLEQIEAYIDALETAGED